MPATCSYPSCNTGQQTFACIHCGNYYCIDHIRPKPPLDTILRPDNPKEHEELEQWNKLLGHPCTQFATDEGRKDSQAKRSSTVFEKYFAVAPSPPEPAPKPAEAPATQVDVYIRSKQEDELRQRSRQAQKSANGDDPFTVYVEPARTEDSGKPAPAPSAPKGDSDTSGFRRPQKGTAAQAEEPVFFNPKAEASDEKRAAANAARLPRIPMVQDDDLPSAAKADFETRPSPGSPAEYKFPGVPPAPAAETPKTADGKPAVSSEFAEYAASRDGAEPEPEHEPSQALPSYNAPKFPWMVFAEVALGVVILAGILLYSMSTAAGVKSSNQATFLFAADASANGAILGTNNATLGVALAGKNSTAAWLVIDGSNCTMTQAADGFWYYTITGLPQGPHSYFVSVHDASTKVFKSDERSFVVDTLPPVVAIANENPPNGTQADNGTISFALTVTDSSPTTMFAILSNGTDQLENDTMATTAFSWTGLPAGSYWYHVDVLDSTNHSTTTPDYFVDMLPRFMGGPRNTTYSYVLRGINHTFTLTTYGSLDTFLQAAPRVFNCTPDCMTAGQMEVALMDENNSRPFLNSLANYIRRQTNVTDDQARIAISLVQRIPYDEASFEADTVKNRYPYEVLYDGTGLCGEKSRLLAYLLRQLGFGTVLFYYPKHETVGIKCPVRYSLEGSGYCFVETTNPTIITDSFENYEINPGLKEPLPANPEIYNVSEGSSFESVAEEYSDMQSYVHITALGKANGGELDAGNYAAWNLIKRKYGLFSAS